MTIEEKRKLLSLKDAMEAAAVTNEHFVLTCFWGDEKKASLEQKDWNFLIPLHQKRRAEKKVICTIPTNRGIQSPDFLKPKWLNIAANGQYAVWFEGDERAAVVFLRLMNQLDALLSDSSHSYSVAKQPSSFLEHSIRAPRSLDELGGMNAIHNLCGNHAELSDSKIQIHDGTDTSDNLIKKQNIWQVVIWKPFDVACRYLSEFLDEKSFDETEVRAFPDEGEIHFKGLRIVNISKEICVIVESLTEKNNQYPSIRSVVEHHEFFKHEEYSPFMRKFKKELEGSSKLREVFCKNQSNAWIIDFSATR